MLDEIMGVYDRIINSYSRLIEMQTEGSIQLLKTIAREEMSDKRMLLFVVPVHVNAGKVVNAHIHML